MITESMRKQLGEAGVSSGFIEATEKYGDDFATVLSYLNRQDSLYADYAKRILDAVNLAGASNEAKADLVFLLYKIDLLPVHCLLDMPSDGSLSAAEVE